MAGLSALTAENWGGGATPGVLPTCQMENKQRPVICYYLKYFMIKLAIKKQIKKIRLEMCELSTNMAITHHIK